MRILIIEDQEKLALSIKKGLEQQGYAADVVHDGEQALRRVELNHKDYDAIILDRMLPTMDGLTLCTTVRAKNIITPILMLTAKDTTGNKVEGLDAGADDYLVKPFAFEELLARVRALLRRPQETLSPTVTVGEITLDTVARRVTKGGKEVPLTLKEMAILEQFLRHPDQVLTRDFIMDHVWDFAFDSFSNVVDVHVKNLRKKLQKRNETLFETVHGLGYRLKTKHV